MFAVLPRAMRVEYPAGDDVHLNPVRAHLLGAEDRLLA
jgi:hypothetical protein